MNTERETDNRPMAAREMTVDEVITAHIETHNRHIAKLMEMRESLHHTVRGTGISRFERLFGALFDNKRTSF